MPTCAILMCKNRSGIVNSKNGGVTYHFLLQESVFTKLDLLNYFSIADNSLQEMPRNVLRHLPHVKTLDLCRNKLTRLTEDDFRDVQELEHLLVASNQISKIERNALPKPLKHIHLGINNLSTLNGALRDLDNLEWIFINGNHFKTIDNELPVNAKNIIFMHAAKNELQSLPKDLRLMPSLKSLYFYDNNLKSLDGTLQKSRKLKRIGLSFKKIERTFLPALEELLAHHNNITALDKDFHGLPALCLADLSNNKIGAVNYELVSKTRCTINGVPSILKIYLQENPVLCDERLYELMAVMESFSARVSGLSACPAPPVPARPQALNDITPDTAPLIVVLPYEGAPRPPLGYRRVGAYMEHVFPPEREGGLPVVVEPPVTLPPAPPAANVVLKWPDDKQAPAAPARLIHPQ